MAHEKVYGFCENKCKVEVAPKTVVDDHETRLDEVEKVVSGGGVDASKVHGNLTVDNIQINGELSQNVRTIKVSPSEYYSTCKGGFCILPYIPSVRYTGTLKSCGDVYSVMNLVCYDSNFNITTVSSGQHGSNNNGTIYYTLTIPADTVMVYTTPGAYYQTSISLPLFSE